MLWKEKKKKKTLRDTISKYQKPIPWISLFHRIKQCYVLNALLYTAYTIPIWLDCCCCCCYFIADWVYLLADFVFPSSLACLFQISAHLCVPVSFSLCPRAHRSHSRFSLFVCLYVYIMYCFCISPLSKSKIPNSISCYKPIFIGIFLLFNYHYYYNVFKSSNILCALQAGKIKNEN